MTLPTREEVEMAPTIEISGWTQVDIERVCEVVEAYTDGELRTRDEWEATIDRKAHLVIGLALDDDGDPMIVSSVGDYSWLPVDDGSGGYEVSFAAVREDEGDASANSAAIRHKLAVEED